MPIKWIVKIIPIKRHTHNCLPALCLGLPRLAGTRKVKPIWILLEQETVSGSGISWAICKSAPRSRQITTPAPHYSSFLQAGCPSCRPTNNVKALKAQVTHYQSNATIAVLLWRPEVPEITFATYWLGRIIWQCGYYLHLGLADEDLIFSSRITLTIRPRYKSTDSGCKTKYLHSCKCHVKYRGKQI